MTLGQPIITEDPEHTQMRPHQGPQQLTDDVFVHSAFSNTFAVKTDAGLFLVDPGGRAPAQRVHDSIRSWTGASLNTALYTHGHLDHAFGLGPWLRGGDRPHIVAHENCVARFHRYRLTAGLNASINGRQFGNPRVEFPAQFDWPTILVRDALTQVIGATDVRYHAAKGETDDALYAWLPQSRYLFTGDLVIWTAPNCGNPQKVQRYPVEWAVALEEMAALGAEWLFPGHGLVVKGERAIRQMLTSTAAWLRSIIDQVLARLNAGRHRSRSFTRWDRTPSFRACLTCASSTTTPSSSCAT